MDVLLIPSATLLPPEMQTQFGKIPSSLYPYLNKAILEHIYSKYKKTANKTYVITYQNSEAIEEYISLKSLPVEIIKLDKVKDIGYTIYYSINKILNNHPDEIIETLFINFGDTITKNTLETSTDTICYDSLTYDPIWTYFKQDNGRITEIIDKESPTNSQVFTDIFIGEFGIKNINVYYNILSKQLKNNNLPIDSFYAALREYSQSNPFTFQKADEWVDIGHNITSFDAKTGVKAREFNTIEIDKFRGILKKTSRDTNKFIDEINWYISIPQKLQYFVPKIYDYSTDEKSPFVSMEYYGYSTLHELLTYGNLSRKTWEQIFEKLEYVVHDMNNYKCTRISAEDMASSMRDMYINKPIKRLNLLQSNPAFTDFFDDEIHINGIEYPSLNDCIDLIPQVVDDKLIHGKKTEYSIIHGDLCFTNILAETNYNFVRLIDPRGSFGEKGIFGDPRYDIAKLLHSLEGNYDFMIEDMMKVRREDNDITVHVKETNPMILSEFTRKFSSYLSDIDSIRLIESSLFLSMVPLHTESPLRQYAMLSTGLKLFMESLK